MQNYISKNKMILSFHPLFVGDKNILCAGRDPGQEELDAIKKASAVVLPQGCRERLFYMASANCSRVFPDYHMRFKYPGKTGQAKLFKETGINCPKTEVYDTVDVFPEKLTFEYPFVFKFDWGGEGETVFLIESRDDMEKIIQKAVDFEKTGQKGFIVQEYVPTDHRSLRVVVIGRKAISYWRTQEKNGYFYSSLSKGAVIDSRSDPAMQESAVRAVKSFCMKTAINLAGFDFLFSIDPQIDDPYFLEINYFFGRRGLGGSEKYYELLLYEIDGWLKEAQ